MRIHRFIFLAVLVGLLALSGCTGTVSVGVAVGNPYGAYAPYGPAYGPYGPYGTVRVGSGPIVW